MSCTYPAFGVKRSEGDYDRWLCTFTNYEGVVMVESLRIIPFHHKAHFLFDVQVYGETQV
jgi:hypothetical protein